MFNRLSVCRLVLTACSLATLAAQSGCGGGGSGPAGFRVAVPSFAQIDALFAADREIDGGRRASMVPATDAGVVAIAAESGWVAALDRAYTGLRRSLSHDVTGEGTASDIASLTVDGQGTILWWRGDDCRIAWRNGGTTRMVVAECGAPGGVGCVYEQGGVTCRRCDTERCGACTWSGGEARCDEVPGAPPPVEDTSPPLDVEADSGQVDVAGDEGGQDDVTEPDASPADVEEADARDAGGGEPDATSETPTPTCSAQCLEERGGRCCLDCACAAGGDCVPICGAGYEWDCALGCCYNYDLFACSCAFPARWDAAQGCCAEEGACTE